MKLFARSLLILLMLCQPIILYAEDVGVMVSPFEGGDSEKVMGKKLAIIAAGEVMGAKGFRFVSPSEFVRTVSGSDKVVVDKAPDLEKEYDDAYLKGLQTISDKKDLSFENFFKSFKTVQILIGGEFNRNGPLIRIDMMGVKPDEEREYVAKVECKEEDLDREVRKAVRRILRKLSNPIKVYADTLIDPEESKVKYTVKATRGADVIVEMDYTGDRPDPTAQSVNLFPPEGVKKAGVATYGIRSAEGRLIYIEFDFKGGKLDKVNVDTPIPDPENMAEQSETLTVKSNVGYELKFDFLWKDAQMTDVKVYPALNPFGDYED